MSRGELLMKLELRSDPELLCAVRGALERLTEQMGFSAPDCRSITLAVDEALTNIIRHAYRGRREQPIVISCRHIKSRGGGHRRTGLEIVLSDHGAAVNRAKLRGRPLDEIRPGGLGLHFIRESMDESEYKRSGRTNRLRLVKYLQREIADQVS